MAADFTVEYRDPRELTPNPLNWRRHPEQQRDLLRYSLDRFGFVQGVVLNRTTGNLIDGHARVEEAIEQGRESIPVNVVDLSEEDERELLRLFDPVGAMAETDSEVLDRLIAQIGNPDLEAMLSGVSGGSGLLVDADPDAIPEAVETRCKPRDLWRLGEHRLLCGDSTVATDVERLLGGAVPALMVTDPPYGVDYDPTWRNDAAEKGLISFAASREGKVQNDDRVDWYEAWTLFPGDVVYCWHADRHASLVQQSLEQAGFEVRCQIIWAKPRFVISRGHYHWQHEPCWYAVKDNATAGWRGDRSQTTLWEIPLTTDDQKTDHGTQKPVECMARAIRNHGGDVYDPFLGSGTTLIAAETLGRTCYGIDIDPTYCDLALARWESATGRTAELING
jgi:DNA modification methylase